MPLAETVLAWALSLSASWFDVRTARIPNALVLLFGLAGLVLSAPHGWQELLWRLAACAAVTVAAYLIFAFGYFGGGDGKLLIALAAIGGLEFVAETALWAVLIGGVAGVVMRAKKERVLDHAERTKIPLAPLVLGGVVTATVDLIVFGGVSTWLLRR